MCVRRGLYDEYTWNVDVRNEPVDTVFTEDGVFTTTPGDRRTSGREQLRTMYQNRKKNRAPHTRHLLSNMSIRATNEGAAGRAYMFTGDGRDGNRPIVTPFGRYDDRLIKTADGWRFKQRIFNFDINLPRTAERP